LTGGTPFTFTGSRANKFFKFTGDWNGNGAVTISDYGTFQYWFGSEVGTTTPIAVGTAPAYADSNGNGAVTIADFGGFKVNFGTELIFPEDPADPEGELIVLPAASNPADVNQDGAVTTRDALNVINALNNGREGEDRAIDRFDTNQDGMVTAADAMFVINRIGRASLTSAGKEPTVDQLLADLEFLAELF
jgi:hypothetical protein